MIALPPVKPEVVTAQIHDEEDDVIEVRLEDNRLIAQYGGGSGDKNEFVIDPAYVLGTPYDLRVVAAAGRIDVFYNGAHSGGAALAGDDWYFKTGSYLQSNVEQGRCRRRGGSGRAVRAPRQPRGLTLCHCTWLPERPIRPIGALQSHPRPNSDHSSAHSHDL